MSATSPRTASSGSTSGARVGACLLCLLLAASADAEALHRLVFGSFGSADSAARRVETLSRELDTTLEVMPFATEGRRGFRVVTRPLDASELQALSRLAASRGLPSWRLLTTVSPEAIAAVAETAGRDSTNAAARADAGAADVDGAPSGSSPIAVGRFESLRSSPVVRDVERDRRQFDLDIGVQSRSFAHAGTPEQSRFQPSASVRARYYRSWNDGETSFRAIPFARLDGQDDRRTHADLREFQVTRVGTDWEVRAGLRQVFWGVTEFVHLVDIVNQIDLVENIDGEDRLGQPMIDLSLVRDWGVLDLMLLPGFRERTFPGRNGRLRFPLPVDVDGATFESDDEQWHVDGAVRWMHSVGPLEFGLYHFRGTGREPDLVPTAKADGRYVLTPHYPQIDQTGLDAQAITGDLALKLEALNRGGQGNRFWAATGGFEWTLVGALGSRADLGLVVEYMYDERGDRGPSVWEHDLGFATRWRFNDVGDTQALVGVTWDHVTNEYIVKLEGSRRLGDDWTMGIEGRVFGGGRSLPTAPPEAVLEALADPDNKTGAVQQDDYLQIELTRFF
jgi:hypothetical protein